MGASESIIIIEQDADANISHELIKTFSSEKYQDVLRLYKALHHTNHENFVEENLLVNENEDRTEYSYITVLVNNHDLTHTFSLQRFEDCDEAKKRFEEFSSVLMPYIDTFPSIYTSKILTSLIKLRSTYPSWDTNKIATHLHLPEVKEFKPKISLNRQQSQHNRQALEQISREQPSFARDFFGGTPLQYFTERHPELVSNLISTLDSLHQTGKDLKDGIDNISKYSESPIHVAIRLSQESVLKLLLEKGANPLIPCGHAYPVHLAMKHDSKGCLKLLLEHNKECLALRDKKYDAPVLHWAKSSDLIDVLAQENQIDLNARNSDSETALHVMVKRKRLSPTISLICHGADVNARGKDGFTPLHYSILQSDIDIIRALLFLGADKYIKDDKGKTAVDYIDENSENYHETVDLFYLFNYEHIEQQVSKSRGKSILKEKTGNEVLLTLDGGGIRGLILTEILLVVESLARKPIYELFDWVSGTSTGSYLAMSLSIGRSVRYCQRAYLRLGRSSLVGIRPYPTEKLDKFLMDEFGHDTKMDAFEFPKVMIPATLVDRRPAMLHLFRNYNAPYDEHYQMRDARFPRPPVPSDQLTWLAIRSSCSAPSYFRSTGRYLDGGLIANNPTLDAMSEIHKHKKYLNQQSKGKKPTETSKVKIIVSVGTGRKPSQLIRPIDIYRPSSVWDTAEIVDNLKEFVDLMVDQVAASDDHVVDRARSWCEMIDVDYYRFNPTLASDIELTETDDRVLLSMLCDVRKYIIRNFTTFEKLSKMLVGEGT